MEVRVTAPVRPTEDEAKVRQAILALFPDAAIQQEQNGLVAYTQDASALRQRVWELRIIDAVRGQLLGKAQGSTCTFRLSKQAALASKVSFPPTPHALGDLEVTVRIEESDPWRDAEAFVWWLAPETKDGEIVGPA